MYKLRKDETHLVAKWKLKVGKKHYFHVFLWEDQDSFKANTIGHAQGKVAACVHFITSISPEVFYKGRSIAALHINEIQYYISEKGIVKPKLGEVHFIKDKWDLEVVAHELCHVLFYRIGILGPPIEKIMEQEYDSEGYDNQETVCYAFGKWVEQTYGMLWEVNPYGKYSKEEEDK